MKFGAWIALILLRLQSTVFATFPIYNGLAINSGLGAWPFTRCIDTSLFYF